MHPIERLRWIARSSGESPALLAAEAAYTLGELSATEPAAVLTAARRLLDRHPSAGPLWWVAARLMAADDPQEAAARAAGELHSDQTGDRLAEALRSEVPPGAVVVVASPVEIAGESFARTRPYAVRLVADPTALRSSLRTLAPVVEDVTGWMAEESAAAVAGSSVALVEVLAGSAELAAVSPAGAAVVAAAEQAGVPAWAVVGTGRALPDGLARAAADRGTAAGVAVAVTPARFSLAIGPHGRGTAAEVMGQTTAPAGTELLRRVL